MRSVPCLLALCLAPAAWAGKPDHDGFVLPVVRVGLYQDPSTQGPDPNLILGATAGVRIRPESPFGLIARPSLTCEHLFGQTRHGDDLELMLPAGPKLGPFVVGSGLALDWDRYVYDKTTYGGTGKVGVPIFVGLDLALAYAWAGVVPEWFVVNPSSRPAVDWSAIGAGGFGDEMIWTVGGGVSLGPVRLRAEWRTTIAAYGQQHQVGLGLGVGF